MMLENNLEREEKRRLLPSHASGAGHDPPSFAIFNDLTYSDDDDDDDDEYLRAAELGMASGSTSSPETAALLNEIQNAMFPVQQQQQSSGATQQPQRQQRHQQQQQQQHHLMHPLADSLVRQSSVQSSVQSGDGDESSYLEYSIASEETRSNYGSLDSGHHMFDLKPSKSTASVIFRPPSVSVFDQSPARSNGQNHPKHSARQTSRHQQQQQQQQKQQQQQPQQQKWTSSRKSTSIKSKSRAEKAHRQGQSVPQSASNTGKNGNGRSPPSLISSVVSRINCCDPVTPLPFAIAESPTTSATATDETRSPTDGDAANGVREGVEDDGEEEGDRPEEKERIERLLSADATKRLRRHRRLKRIKKAAEAREAAVQKVRGTEQNDRCNDAIFAFIFLCHFLLVSMAALAFGPGALRDKIYGSFSGDQGENAGGDAQVDYNPFAGLQTDDVIINPLFNGGGAGADVGQGKGVISEEEERITHIDYINVIQLVCVASGYASFCSLLALGFMMTLSKSLLRATLAFTIGACALWTALGFAFSSYWIIPLSGVAALALSTIYAIVVWDRVPFAATNLNVALKGMRSTLDVPFVGLGVLAVTFLWTIWWICAFVGTFDFLNDDEELSNDWMSVVVIFFLFSYYWTFQVIKGISQTTVASIIGKWWDMSEDDSLPTCSSVLHSTFSRNIVRSFGSICLGSLVVCPCIFLTRISTLMRLARPKLGWLKTLSKPANIQLSSNSKIDGECDNMQSAPHSLSQTKPKMFQNVNQWSFTYVGLYGYKFWNSGSMASQLFEARGWTHVVSDDLIMTVMFMSSMIIGGSTACLGLIVEEMDGYDLTSLNKPVTTAFLICLVVGYSLSSAFLSIIEGSVSAILVCYAAAPVEFHVNHHTLSEEMKSAWKHFWLQKPTK